MNGYEENDHLAEHRSPGTCGVMSSRPGAPKKDYTAEKRRGRGKEGNGHKNSQ